MLYKSLEKSLEKRITTDIDTIKIFLTSIWMDGISPFKWDF